ncbi:Hypothetical predicted protein [Mytilus galloprovincialis]|uniref:Ion transport domain-containing protein n=1 Tax=Mytilus galloprovincialis TaxID=29158 RepID=A0A8B6H0V7_MYTGA|nr:Hypothetical predicted protein [Mytilus galloprovincialis]
MHFLDIEQTKLPCHVVGQKVLFHHGSSRKVVIHHKTSKDTIKELVKKGCLTFERGDTDDKEGELPYFIRMAEYVLSEKVLPVIISLRNGGLRKEVLVSAKELNIPILLFKNNSPDISVFTLELDTESTPELSTDSKLKTTEHTTNTKTPWTARKSKTCKVQATDDTDNKEEISAINDVESTMDFDALICNVVIGDVDKPATEDEKNDNKSIFSTKESGGTEMMLAVSTSELYGLIFLALLKKRFYPGAKQLVETGCRAIQITSCIYEAEHKKEDSKSRGQTVSNNEVVENELGEPIGHTSRLLLNHGYLENAIKTQNKTFLDNITVKKVLNKMWYGEEETSIIQLGYIALLTAYAYMLLFKINEELSYTDFFIIGWMTSLFLDETKQALVSAYRKRFRMYLTNWWNMLDWTLMYAYTFAMGLKFGDDQKYQDASKILLIVTFILLGIRILNMFSMSEFLGPKLVMIQKMFKDTFAFMIILLVMMISYNVSFYSLLYPNSELSWSEIEKVMQNGYWMLFGELNLDSDTLTEPDCTFNKTIYTSGALSRCPATLGLYVSPYLKALYGLIAVILMLNLLIAIYNDTFQQVHQESEFHWAQLQTDFLEEYSVKTIFPIHLQLLALPVCLIQFILWCTFPCFYTKVKRRCSKNNQDGDNNNMKNSFDSETDKLNDNPMFVRGKHDLADCKY